MEAAAVLYEKANKAFQANQIDACGAVLDQLKVRQSVFGLPGGPNFYYSFFLLNIFRVVFLFVARTTRCSR